MLSPKCTIAFNEEWHTSVILLDKDLNKVPYDSAEGHIPVKE